MPPKVSSEPVVQRSGSLSQTADAPVNDTGLFAAVDGRRVTTPSDAIFQLPRPVSKLACRLRGTVPPHPSVSSIFSPLADAGHGSATQPGPVQRQHRQWIQDTLQLLQGDDIDDPLAPPTTTTTTSATIEATAALAPPQPAAGSSLRRVALDRLSSLGHLPRSYFVTRVPQLSNDEAAAGDPLTRAATLIHAAVSLKLLAEDSGRPASTVMPSRLATDVDRASAQRWFDTMTHHVTVSAGDVTAAPSGVAATRSVGNSPPQPTLGATNHGATSGEGGATPALLSVPGPSSHTAARPGSSTSRRRASHANAKSASADASPSLPADGAALSGSHQHHHPHPQAHATAAATPATSAIVDATTATMTAVPVLQLAYREDARHVIVQLQSEFYYVEVIEPDTWRLLEPCEIRQAIVAATTIAAAFSAPRDAEDGAQALARLAHLPKEQSAVALAHLRSLCLANDETVSRLDSALLHIAIGTDESPALPVPRLGTNARAAAALFDQPRRAMWPSAGLSVWVHASGDATLRVTTLMINAACATKCVSWVTQAAAEVAVSAFEVSPLRELRQPVCILAHRSKSVQSTRVPTSSPGKVSAASKAGSSGSKGGSAQQDDASGAVAAAPPPLAVTMPLPRGVNAATYLPLWIPRLDSVRQFLLTDSKSKAAGGSVPVSWEAVDVTDEFVFLLAVAVAGRCSATGVSLGDRHVAPKFTTFFAGSPFSLDDAECGSTADWNAAMSEAPCDPPLRFLHSHAISRLEKVVMQRLLAQHGNEAAVDPRGRSHSSWFSRTQVIIARDSLLQALNRQSPPYASWFLSNRRRLQGTLVTDPIVARDLESRLFGGATCVLVRNPCPQPTASHRSSTLQSLGYIVATHQGTHMINELTTSHPRGSIVVNYMVSPSEVNSTKKTVTFFASPAHDDGGSGEAALDSVAAALSRQFANRVRVVLRMLEDIVEDEIQSRAASRSATRSNASAGAAAIYPARSAVGATAGGGSVTTDALRLADDVALVSLAELWPSSLQSRPGSRQTAAGTPSLKRVTTTTSFSTRGMGGMSSAGLRCASSRPGTVSASLPPQPHHQLRELRKSLRTVATAFFTL